LDLSEYSFQRDKAGHLIHIAKIARYKGQHLAILAARKTKAKLQIAGNVEDKLYFYGFLKPLIKVSVGCSYIGEVNGTKDSLSHARCLIQTPRWFDAFPLVILESLASGTPVIAFSEGGIPEQIVHGKTGFLCHNVNELSTAIENVSSLRLSDCRTYAEEHFTVQRMAQQYLNLYERVLDSEQW
jgi:glycosyltransferase involved in cell wall biosynthesis